jgi:hypothetical protein
MAVKAADIPGILLKRVAEAAPNSAVFDADELAEWPGGVVDALFHAGLLQGAPRATEVFCDGCEWRCLKPVVVRTTPNGARPRAFVHCDEEPDLGRIPVPLERLRRYRASVTMIAALAARSLGLDPSAKADRDGSITLGSLGGRHGRRVLRIAPNAGRLLLHVGSQAIELSAVVLWEGRTVRADRGAIQKLVDQRAERASAAVSNQPRTAARDARKQKTEKRNRRILREALRLRKKTKNWSGIAKQVAKMDFVRGISAGRVRRIITERK